LRSEVTKLAREQRQFARNVTEAILQLTEQQKRLGKRLDDFRKDVYRGFTGSASRDQSLDRRLTAVERPRRT